MTKDRRHEHKKKAVKALGGRCSRCLQVFRDLEVYDFHHIKDSIFNTMLSSMWSHSWRRIKLQLKRCKLLCANCHRIEHKELRDKDDNESTN